VALGVAFGSCAVTEEQIASVSTNDNKLLRFIETSFDDRFRISYRSELTNAYGIDLADSARAL